jgi:hypothetical protein
MQSNSVFQSSKGEVSIYDNQTSQMGRERYSLVQIPLRTKVSTGRPFKEGKSPSMSLIQSTQDNNYKETLREMK